MFIKYTYVDSITGIPVTKEIARNGPKPPALPDLVYGFALESEYPTEKPTYFGTCRDGTPGTTPGILAILTEAEYNKARENEKAIMLSRARDAKYDALKQRRKDSELRGVLLSGMGDQVFVAPISIPAEKDDQDRINSTLTGMERWKNEIFHISFKAANNIFIDIDYDQLNYIGLRVAKLAQAAFANEGVHSRAISALKTIDEIVAYDISTGWPN